MIEIKTRNERVLMFPFSALASAAGIEQQLLLLDRRPPRMLRAAFLHKSDPTYVFPGPPVERGLTKRFNKLLTIRVRSDAPNTTCSGLVRVLPKPGKAQSYLATMDRAVTGCCGRKYFHCVAFLQPRPRATQLLRQRRG